MLKTDCFLRLYVVKHLSLSLFSGLSRYHLQSSSAVSPALIIGAALMLWVTGAGNQWEMSSTFQTQCRQFSNDEKHEYSDVGLSLMILSFKEKKKRQGQCDKVLQELQIQALRLTGRARTRTHTRTHACTHTVLILTS